VRGAVEHGWRIKAVRWTMLSGPAFAGVNFFAFYALQPHLLELYGDPTAYGVAGVASAIVALGQIGGGLSVPVIRRFVHRRTTVIAVGIAISAAALLGIGLAGTFWVAIGFLVVWSLTAAVNPVRQAFLNGCIVSDERATVLSFDALLASGGGAIAQPLLGRVADLQGYGAAYLVTGGFQLLALPFVWLARRQNSPGDILAPIGEA
jgi:MFS family permease